MKHFFLTLTFMVALVGPLLAAFVVPDPAAQAVGATDEETYKLYQAVTGAEWDYVWRHTTVQIDFGPDGQITHGPWGRPSWRITGPRTISIDAPSNRPGAKEMILRFNPEMTRWSCTDWSKDRAEGIRRKPNAAATK